MRLATNHGNTLFTRDGLRRLAKSYHMRPAKLRKLLAKQRRKAKARGIHRFCFWTTRTVQHPALTLDAVRESVAQIREQAGVIHERWSANLMNDDNIALMSKQTFKQEICKHENIAVYPEPDGNGEKYGPFFAKCYDCGKRGPVRKTEHGAKQALLKGLVK